MIIVEDAFIMTLMVMSIIIFNKYIIPASLYLNLKQHISNIVGISGKRKNGPMKYSSVKISEEMDMTPNVFENRSVKELIRGKLVRLVKIVYLVKRHILLEK